MGAMKCAHSTPKPEAGYMPQGTVVVKKINKLRKI